MVYLCLKRWNHELNIFPSLSYSHVLSVCHPPFVPVFIQSKQRKKSTQISQHMHWWIAHFERQHSSFSFTLSPALSFWKHLCPWSNYSLGSIDLMQVLYQHSCGNIFIENCNGHKGFSFKFLANSTIKSPNLCFYHSGEFGISSLMLCYSELAYSFWFVLWQHNWRLHFAW